MKTFGYIGIWVGLMVATALELTIIGLPLGTTRLISGILGLVVVKALLIAVFYQNLLHESKSISSLYLLGLVVGTGLLLALAVTYH